MAYEYVAVVTPPKFWVTWATSWGRLQGLVDVIKILENVSCEYDRWVVETQLCKLRDTSDTLIGRACAVSHCNMVFVNYIYDMVVDTQFHKFHDRPFILWCLWQNEKRQLWVRPIEWLKLNFEFWTFLQATWYRLVRWACFYSIFHFIKKWKTSAVSTTDGWLKLNFASWVIRQTRSSWARLCYVSFAVFHL